MDRRDADLYEALTEALIEHAPHRLSDHPHIVRLSAAFVREEMDRLPLQLRVLLRVGLAVFCLAVRCRYLRSYARLPLTARQQILTSWAFGPFLLTRQLFRPIRATALLAYYEYAHSVRSDRVGER